MGAALEAGSGVGVPNPSAELLLQFLAWVADQPRNYAEAMEAWRTSCPRLSVWEDATADGLVRLEAAATDRQGSTAVRLTEAGAALLAGAQRAGALR